jgi:hypothetical protein
MRNRSGENGQVIVLVLLSMGLLLGVLALAIDVGVLFRAKRNVQIAADAAAFAGALDYYYNGSDATAESRGALAAEANGMTSYPDHCQLAAGRRPQRHKGGLCGGHRHPAEFNAFHGLFVRHYFN